MKTVADTRQTEKTNTITAGSQGGTLPAVPVQMLETSKATEEEQPIQGKFALEAKNHTAQQPQVKQFQFANDISNVRGAGTDYSPAKPFQFAGIEKEEPVQMKPFQLHSEESQPLPIQKKPNNTGLPDNLKNGVENLSGITMDDVNVHYNSAKPAQLQALAYAQGTDIHIGPRQERHLPHEAWHVVQQKQGRVQPTLQMKEGVAVNDDKGLEQEADAMGEKAVQFFPLKKEVLRKKDVYASVIQGVFFDIESKNFKSYIGEQEEKQNNIGKNDSRFTTVGFEHEFTQTKDENKLAGISHLELAKSRPLPFTGLPFILETDAANALELVSPPFLIKTLPETFIPNPADVETVDNMIRIELENLASLGTIGNLLEGFKSLAIDFTAVKDLKIESKNVSHKSKVQDYLDEQHSKLNFENLKDIEIKPTEKGGGITSQVNFATNAKTFGDIEKINKDKGLVSEKGVPGFNPKAILATLQNQIGTYINDTKFKPTPNIELFTSHLARILSSQFAVPPIETVKKMQDEIYSGVDLKADGQKLARFRFSAYLTSAVKDIHGVWIKDSLMNVGLGILDYSEWREVKKIITSPALKEGIAHLALPVFTNINGFEKNDKEGNELISNTLDLTKAEMIKALEMIYAQIGLIERDGRPSKNLAIVPEEKVGFMEHNQSIIGPRQDTYIDPRKAQIRGIGERLHVVETRRDSIETLYKLGLDADKLDRDALLKLATQYEKKISIATEEIIALEKKAEAIHQEPEILELEYRDKEKELLILNDKSEYNLKFEKFKAEYKEKNEGKEPGKNQIKAFEKEIAAPTLKLQKRLRTIEELLKFLKTEIPRRLQNVEKEIIKIKEQIEILTNELDKIKWQLSKR